MGTVRRFCDLLLFFALRSVRSFGVNDFGTNSEHNDLYRILVVFRSITNGKCVRVSEDIRLVFFEKNCLVDENSIAREALNPQSVFVFVFVELRVIPTHVLQVDFTLSSN